MKASETFACEDFQAPSVVNKCREASEWNSPPKHVRPAENAGLVSVKEVKNRPTEVIEIIGPIFDLLRS